jgi:hypothetical protein
MTLNRGKARFRWRGIDDTFLLTDIEILYLGLYQLSLPAPSLLSTSTMPKTLQVFVAFDNSNDSPKRRAIIMVRSVNLVGGEKFQVARSLLVS